MSESIVSVIRWYNRELIEIVVRADLNSHGKLHIFNLKIYILKIDFVNFN